MTEAQLISFPSASASLYTGLAGPSRCQYVGRAVEGFVLLVVAIATLHCQTVYTQSAGYGMEIRTAGSTEAGRLFDRYGRGSKPQL